MKRYLILVFIASLFIGNVNAQQEAMYSQYMFNTLAINPAYAGSRNVTSATALYRSQWVGIDGAPETLTFTLDAPLNNKKIGLGLQVFSDKIGVTQNTGAMVSYAYRIRMATGTLSFGLQAGYSQFRGAFSTVPLNSSGYNNDVVFQDVVNKGLLNIGSGVYYNSDRFYVGLSAPQLLNNQLNGFSVSTDNSYAGQRLHLFLASGYVFPLSQDFDLKPSILVKGVKGAPIQADLNANLWIKQVFSIGMQYRSSADIAAMVEV
ncbi:MAG: type IX secretion system membrane protein PorP/SprF, partial [Sphingobacteriales bacterium]